MDTYVEVTRRGLFGRLGSSIKGIVFGGILFVAAFPILFINEGCAVKDHKRLAEAREAAVEVTADAVDPNLEGSLLVVSGLPTTDEELVDPVFSIKVNALRLKRRAEMLQWEEKTSTRTKKSVGGSETTETEYRYSTEWSSSVIRSTDFKKPTGHENPSTMSVSSESFQAANVALGAFQLSPDLVQRIDNDVNVELSEQTLMELPDEAQGQYQLADGYLYKGKDPSNPTIGDIRVRFAKVLPSEVTVRSQQSGSSFAPWSSSLGTSVHEIRMGTYSAVEMNDKAVTAAKTRTWLVRVAGIVVMGIGLSVILGPLAVLADVVPFIGNLVRSASALVAFTIALALSFVVIAVAWFTYRPMISVPLLVGAGLLTWWLNRRESPAAIPPALPQDEVPPPLA